MGTEYDRKFQEMKMYIPFLESMIKRLESTSSASSNPRQAQLDKIRSLRDLLLDKKKRMKMENLLKCEQVLVNLYAKVEQRDGFADVKPASDTEVRKENPDLETVRNKLKAVTKLRDGDDTLPEIARASQTEEICTPGSKEPALFQRRPNKVSTSPPKDCSITNPRNASTSKRNYTRVLLSPEPSVRRRPSESLSEQSLFSRRSPRRSPRRHSPIYHKKERKKSSKESKSRKSKDLNITLNVPEERLESLNTTDILSRIINCSDGDVDIDTLRELRSQILGELKQTGAHEDISDLILKSYKKEKTKSNDVEEGELSDSESEAIENIYGSLVFSEKDQSKQKPADKRKIKICLVINSEKEEIKPVKEINNFDLTQTDAVEDTPKTKDVISLDSDESLSPIKKIHDSKNVNTAKNKLVKATPTTKADVITVDDDEKASKKFTRDMNIDDSVLACDDNTSNTVKNNTTNKVGSPVKMNQPPPNNYPNSDSFDFLPTLKQIEQSDKIAEEKSQTKNVANFYKPINEEETQKSNNGESNENDSCPKDTKQPGTIKATDQPDPNQIPNSTEFKPSAKSSEASVNPTNANKTETSSQAKSKGVSEIDILQALKNEILSETIPIATSEIDTPALHQPKLTKVSSANEILTKKRISIENYKKKSTVTSNDKQLFTKERQDEARDKKQSLKLTEKECERFNLPVRLSLDEEDISDDDFIDDSKKPSDDNLYGDLAPKSPDNETVATGVTKPVIIPTDPVKTVVASSSADVDMRTALPPQPVPPPATMPLIPPLLDLPLIDLNTNRINVDPRMRKESGPPKPCPNQFAVNPEGTPRTTMFPNIPPLLTPSYTPSYTPNMTPIQQMTPNARSFDMTPSHSSFDVDESIGRKHVYAPTFSAFDRETSVPRDPSFRDKSHSGSIDDRQPQRDDRIWDDRNVQATSMQRNSSRHRYEKYQDLRHDRYQDSSYEPYLDSRNDKYSDLRSDKFREQRYQNPRREKYSDVRNDKYRIDRRQFSKPDSPLGPFAWSECPTTPIHAFGRSDHPTTPNHPFGRSDCPSTPSHPFGRSDCPTTPSHPFGRSDCPTTPSHPFGRSNCPTTPIHSFGRSDCPTTPSHPFGCSEAPKPPNQSFRKDPRLNRRSEVESRPNFNERERSLQGDRQYGRGGYNDSKYSSSKSYDREDSSGHKSRYYDSEPRESRGGRSISKDAEMDLLNPKPDTRDYGQQGYNRSVQDNKYRNYRSTSVGRSARQFDTSNSDNKLSVKSKSGRSFVIDTSVNSSFQKLIEGKGIEVFDYSFNSKRQRAASVGRSLAPETSVGCQMAKTIPNIDPKNDRMKRASSVGRDLLNSDKQKSLMDLKAEFEAFKQRIGLKVPSMRVIRQEPIKKVYHHSRRDNFQQHGRRSNDVPSYSPRKNSRDPRMRRDQRGPKNKSRSDSDSRDRNQFGIVYSNDNIAKGTIMGTGFGVKKYKIPKIKRSEPEPEPEPEPTPTPTSEPTPTTEIDKIEKLPEKKPPKASVKKEQVISKSDKVMKKDQDKIKTKNVVDTTKGTETSQERPKRLTRSSKKSEMVSKQEELAPKGKKNKKGVIYDSDSDDDSIKKEQKTNKILNSPKKVNSKGKNETTAARNENSDLDSISQSSFVIDDMSLFPDTIVNDPVIDNINALIADLDHDLVEKTVSPTAIENIMDSIDSPEDSFGDISEVIQNDLDETEKLKRSDSSQLAKVETNKKLNYTFDELKKTGTVTEKSDIILENHASDKEQISEQNSELNVSIENNENVVTTTDIHFDDQSTNEDSNKLDKNKDAEVDDSVPDSTINKPEQGLPDSTNEISNQTSALVTSTDDSEMGKKEGSSEPTSSRKEIESIGSLLSILQNKSKLKEILSMLGDQSGDSDKIKKKLEKLSEIVSDDDESNDAMSNAEKMSDAKATAVKELDIQSSTNTVISEIEKNNGADCAKMDIDDKQVDEQHKNENDVNKDISDVQSTVVSEKINTTTDSKSVSIEAVPKSVEPREKIETDSASNKSDLEYLDKTQPKETVDESTLKEKALAEEENLTSKELASAKENDSQCKHMPSEDEEEQTEATQEEVVNDKPLTKIGKKKITKKIKGKAKPKKMPVKILKKIPSCSVVVNKPCVKKRGVRSRELKQLQDDIKEMFMKDDILNATGIRMCRLAKLIDDKNENKEEISDGGLSEPVVVIEKCNVDNLDELPLKLRKKAGPKPKDKKQIFTTEKLEKPYTKTEKAKSSPKTRRPGPKSRKREASDPYDFDTDSLAETSTTKDSEDDSESDNESLGSSSQSFGSSEVLADLKKRTKRQRRRWKVGVIRTKNRKRKEQKHDVDEELLTKPVTIPDFNCFTDKTYSFKKNVKSYECRLCLYSGDEIVKHYRKEHPHTEIPLSRIEQSEAKLAIAQCEEMNFQVISKMSTDKYTCRFCYKQFNGRKQVLENFFWHIVSTHTGEYKQTCYECVTDVGCPYNLDIPPPPKELQKQLIGYICGKCNFTQISLENLKTHVIVRHNDEQTEVYTINLSVISKKTMSALMRRSQAVEQPRVLRSTRSNQSTAEASDDSSYITESEQTEDVPLQSVMENKGIPSPPYKTKIFFENDDVNVNTTEIKVEQVDNDREEITNYDNEPQPAEEPQQEPKQAKSRYNTDNIMDCAHFRVHFTESGTKEYVCCINGNIHYKTGLLISMKRHVQNKHVEDNWDGYCSLCKVIVTLQGVKSNFKDCLDHYLSKHNDDFPVAEKLLLEKLPAPTHTPTPPPTSAPTPAKPYITVRPLAELMTKELNKTESEEPKSETALPVIETVVSLGDSNIPIPTSVPQIVDKSLSAPRIATPPIGVPPLSVARMSPATTPVPALSPIVPRIATPVLPPPYHVAITEIVQKKPFEYEEVQADVMSKKHRVVLDAMMAKSALIRVFKCAGRFCSFTTDSAEDALLHASTHQRVGGEDALRCTYCSFDSMGNAIDLVMHVFKEHSRSEYCCGLCFYRAAAVQLVAAHFGKMHASTGAQLSVLRNTSTSTQPPDNKDILTREQAVPYYVCKINESTCKFRSYIPGKFCEHANQKHLTATSHPCYICQTSMPTCAELIEHMKGHGLRLYQCTWCVFGASKEPELVSHVASLHPNRLPQAYLRIITNKEGTTDLRVLPLANLNKSTVCSENVTPSNIRENPVKEAERSIDLEKLIGQANTQANNLIEPLVPQDSPKTSTQEDLEPKVSETPEIPVKSEPKDDNTFNPNVVICLDSDEESETAKPPEKTPEKAPTPQTTTNVNHVKIVDGTLLKCPFCMSSYKTKVGLTKHARACKLKHTNPMKCPHAPCTQVFETLSFLYQHYDLDHSVLSKKHVYMCHNCNLKFDKQNMAKAHLKESHGVDKGTMNVEVRDDGSLLHILIPLKQGQKEQKAVKRKSSTEVKKGPEPPKRFQPDTPKKYGIHDINKLPITPILDTLVYCDLCEFSTKVRLNMIRHLQLHAENQSVPQTAPVNPVPHLETNEKHFDKMVNLASSSVVTRAPEKTKDGNPTVSLLIPLQSASQYPKYVPERQRYTCGAKGCTYISLDETMLRCHWETLHAGSTDYHCVHCPPHQHLDTSKPLTASHIIAHLKMHDITLYACSSCTYYHYKKQAVEKHLSEQHKTGQVMVVREEYVPPPVGTSSSIVAPTMDLKAWQCGLCQFKSMLRPEVVDHCSKNHQSKMQYKCGYCPFRTSAIENVSKHQTNSHPGKSEDIFYYFYKEGSIPNEDGVPLWLKQKQKTSSSEVKSEPEQERLQSQPPPTIPATTSTIEIDLNIVKYEPDENDPNEVLSIDDLCKKYGQFCQPNGIKYKCCLCNVAMEHTREDMQSHLFEELSYRRWSCAVCPYKAYHRTGLNEHMASDHPRQYSEPTQLPIDYNIQKWVSSFLDYQQAIIDKNKENFAKQKIVVEKPQPIVRNVVETPKARICSNAELEQVFGSFGAPLNGHYCCPKCNSEIKDENEMRNHLEIELTKIRWCCTNCHIKFQTYHEAQFHCRSVHTGQPARPIEAIRDPTVRSSWVTAVINTQKQSKVNTEPSTSEKNDGEENSLLVEMYAERASLDEHGAVTRKRPADSDEEVAKTSEPLPKRPVRGCPHCNFKHKLPGNVLEHILRHYDLKPFTCGHCTFNSNRKNVLLHMESEHPYLPRRVRPTKIPDLTPIEYSRKRTRESDLNIEKVCLECEKCFTVAESERHMHGEQKPEFGARDEKVLKCSICFALKSDMTHLQAHHKASHPNLTLNYTVYKLLVDCRFVLQCKYCLITFQDIVNMRRHHKLMHCNLALRYTPVPFLTGEGEGKLQKITKCVAKKSTTKLPNQTVARKSTTKLPHYYIDSEEEYSFYGTKPESLSKYKNVTTKMPMFNTVVDIDVNKFSTLLNIDPRVVISDLNKK